MEPRERVLDVGTGNGPVPKLMAGRMGAACPRIDAIDVAAIRPDWWSAAAYPHIRFHAGVGAGDLPFEADGFDWLVSQYGFEYGERASSLAECRRVLRPGGRVAMVLHHRDSVVCRVGQVELGHYRQLLSADGLVTAAGQVIPYVHEAATRGAAAMGADVHARAARESYNAAMTDLAARIADTPHPDALVEARQGVHALVCTAASRPLRASLDDLQRMGGQLGSAATRLEDLLEHALDERQVGEIAAAFAGGRADAISLQPLRQPEGILGWALRIG